MIFSVDLGTVGLMNTSSPGQTRTQCHAHPERGSRCSSAHGSNQQKGDSDSAQSATLAPAGQTSSPHINDPNLSNERRLIHPDDPNLTNEHRLIHGDIPNLTNERRLIHGDIPNLSNERRFIHPDEPNLTNEHRLIHGDIPNLSTERRFIHADIPNLSNERPYTNTDGRTTSPLTLPMIPLRCLELSIAAQSNRCDFSTIFPGRSRHHINSCLRRRSSGASSTEIPSGLQERTLYLNKSTFVVFSSGNMPAKFEVSVMLFSTLLTSIFIHIDEVTRFEQVHCRT